MGLRLMSPACRSFSVGRYSKPGRREGIVKDSNSPPSRQGVPPPFYFVERGQACLPKLSQRRYGGELAGIVGILIKGNGDVFFECCLEFTSQGFDKLCNPAIACLPAEARRRQVVFVTVGDKDVVLVSGEERGHCQR